MPRIGTTISLVALFPASFSSLLFARESSAWNSFEKVTRLHHRQRSPPPMIALLSSSRDIPDEAAAAEVNGGAVASQRRIHTGDRDGLIRYDVPAEDGHLLRLYGRLPRPKSDDEASHLGAPVLLLHGRTWSSQPVFDLRTSPTDERRQSLLQTLNGLGFPAYALDFRGFGETKRDETGYTTPRRCVEDVRSAIDWIEEKHGLKPKEHDGRGLGTGSISLLGWSQGALVAQLYAQEYGRETLKDLVLFGSIYDPRVVYPRKPIYEDKAEAPREPNAAAAALEDFTLPGSICDEAAAAFESLALSADPIRAAWSDLHEFNACSPGLVQVPTLIVTGSQDPYVNREAQQELFDRLGTDDKVWTVLPGCDHAAHILQRRHMFVRAIVGFWRRMEGPLLPFGESS